MIKKCVVCGKEFETKFSYQKYCSLACYKEQQRRFKRKDFIGSKAFKKLAAKYGKIPADSAVCIICGKTFKPNFYNERFCSNECRLNSPLYNFLARIYSSNGVELFL